MLYTINKGNVDEYSEGQELLIYLKTTVQAVRELNLDFTFTDGHAIVAFSEFYKDIEDLRFIDWEVMEGKYWMDTEEDNDRSRRRQAEFLVHKFAPWSLVQEVRVMTPRIKLAVERVLQDFGDNTPVYVQRDWYY